MSAFEGAILKVSKVQLEEFRHLHHITIETPNDGGLVCLTGENGSGKTTILKVISAAFARLGLASGGEDFTPSPGETWDAQIWFDFSDEGFFVDNVAVLNGFEHFSEIRDKWNGVVEVGIRRSNFEGTVESRDTVIFHGADFAISEPYPLEQVIASWFDERSELKHLTLDSNRAYIPDFSGRWDRSSMAELGTIFGRKAAAALGATDQYHQWLVYAHETNTRTLMNARERARVGGNGDGGILEGYIDPFESLNDIVVRILPHLRIIGTDPDTRQLRVETGGRIVEFSALSGGEREILFLAGQIDRLRLTNGVLIIDEPELHLHPDMVRRLISVVGEISGGAQIWIATHSFEAVEAAGFDRVFIVNRDSDGFSSVDQLTSGSAASALTAALGTPGLSLIGKTFVIVEGGREGLLERRRFARLFGKEPRLRFVREGSSKVEVKRSLESYKALASESGDQLVVKAIVDADFDTFDQGSSNVSDDVFQLSVHEIENLFLFPQLLDYAVKDFLSDGEAFDSKAAILELSDDVAGRWIWDRTQYRNNSSWRDSNILGQVKLLRGQWSSLSWDEIVAQTDDLLDGASKVHPTLVGELQESVVAYESHREKDTWWMHCFGKEILKGIGIKLGFRGSDRLENFVSSVWERNPIYRPECLNELRAFLDIDERIQAGIR